MPAPTVDRDSQAETLALYVNARPGLDLIGETRAMDGAVTFTLRDAAGTFHAVEIDPSGSVLQEQDRKVLRADWDAPGEWAAAEIARRGATREIRRCCECGRPSARMRPEDECCPTCRGWAA